MRELTGKTALVTGSTDGVGRVVACRLGEAGARVLVHGRDAERGARVVADIEKLGGEATFLKPTWQASPTCAASPPQYRTQPTGSRFLSATPVSVLPAVFARRAWTGLSCASRSITW